MDWGIRISWVMRLFWDGSGVSVGFRFPWSCFSCLVGEGGLRWGRLAGGLAGCVSAGG